MKDSAYEGLSAYYGDLHNHCAISYGHGSLEDALANARQRLDFCSVTGHAHWADMPEPNPRIAHILDFHREGFSRLREQWPRVQERMREADREGSFVTFLGFEVHSNAHGDHTVVYRDFNGELLHPAGIPELKRLLARLQERGREAIAFPHHLGYPRGARGINWDGFTPEFSPVVEIVSMHGCSEASEGTRPFLQTMGPSEWRSTMQFGLASGHRFGVIGGTDHHAAHPGSYGHGLAGLWARSLSREALWEALLAGRSYALTGDRIELGFAVNGRPMGERIPAAESREIEVSVVGGAAIDCLDILRNNRLLRRYSPADLPAVAAGPSSGRRDRQGQELVHTKIHLEVGWGLRDREQPWEVSLGISHGTLLAVEPRFRGREVLSPLDQRRGSESFHTTTWERSGEREVRFRTITRGNPNSQTRITQGICLEVEMSAGAGVSLDTNGRRVEVPLQELTAGARAGYLIDEQESPAWRLHRAPLEAEWRWRVRLEDRAGDAREEPGAPRWEAPWDVYYARVRQVNDQWAWSSPVFVERG